MYAREETDRNTRTESNDGGEGRWQDMIVKRGGTKERGNGRKMQAVVVRLSNICKPEANGRCKKAAGEPGGMGG